VTNSNIKVFELAKQLKMSSKELVANLESLGYTYKITSVIKDDIETIIQKVQSMVSKDPEIIKEKEVEGDVLLVGSFYNPNTRKYHVASIKLDVETFKENGGILDKGHGTIYIAKPKIGAVMEKLGVFRPKKGQL